jgi:uncharacterized protein YprB with RNaseH-like and TPR domain
LISTWKGKKFMLQNTFLHIPGIGEKTEQALWEEGICSWDDLLLTESNIFSGRKRDQIKKEIEDSQDQLQNKNVAYFADHLPPKEYWRFFPEFRETTAYLNVETTSLDPWFQAINVMTLYDGKKIFSYVYGKNLRDFVEDVKKYSVIITYNGSRLDLPFIRFCLGEELEQGHIDLRYSLNSLGYKGGLHRCEKKAGIDRGDLEGLDGCSAILLMEEYENKNNQKALETLLAYSAYDAVDLEPLMVLAYNLKLKKTPFADSHQLPLPKSPEIPFKADLETIEDLNYWDLVERSYHSRSIYQWLYSDWSIKDPISNLESKLF